MFNWLIHRLASVLPPAIDSSSEQMRFSTTQKRFFLRETRFLFLSANGPVEFCLRPAHIFSGFSGGVALAVLIFLAPALPNLPSLSSLPSLNSIKQLVTLIPMESERIDPEDTETNWQSLFKDAVTTTLLTPHLPSHARPCRCTRSRGTD